jgi:hypothetical protein
MVGENGEVPSPVRPIVPVVNNAGSRIGVSSRNTGGDSHNAGTGGDSHNAGSRAGDSSRSTGGDNADSSGGGNNDGGNNRPKRVSARTMGLMHRTAHLTLSPMRLEAAAWFPPLVSPGHKCRAVT